MGVIKLGFKLLFMGFASNYFSFIDRGICLVFVIIFKDFQENFQLNRN